VIIAAEYSFNNGAKVISAKWPHLLVEIQEMIDAIDASRLRTKKSREKTMPGQMLYNPAALNKAFAKEFNKRKWAKQRVQCEYSSEHYVNGYAAKQLRSGAFREMDFIKDKVGVEVQMGKYAFMVYNVCAKMTIFHKLGFIDAGVEIVPVKSFADEMSTGVSYFEQFVWDLDKRGVADIDIPVLVLGVDCSSANAERARQTGLPYR